MTRLQKLFCVILCLFFCMVLTILPEPFSLWKIWKNMYRQFPFYVFVEEKTQETWLELDLETTEKILAENKKIREPVPTAKPTLVPTLTLAPTATAIPAAALFADRLSDPEFLMNQFYIVDENADISQVTLDGRLFLGEDLSLKKTGSGPEILIYHSHSQEMFADSREGVEEDSIVGVGNYLTQILTEQYGYEVLHVKTAFDLMGGELDRSKAYDYAGAYIEKLLEENPSVEVVIDLHRDGVEGDKKLVTQIQGKPTAQILFYNGVSCTKTQGKVSYLPNPYLQKNLAFSFQLEYQAALYYPDFYRGIYLAGLRYNLHLKERALLLEAGAQTNTVQEVKNAMEPFADILNRVLKGSDKQN